MEGKGVLGVRAREEGRNGGAGGKNQSRCGGAGGGDESGSRGILGNSRLLLSIATAADVWGLRIERGRGGECLCLFVRGCLLLY